jgi:hypothetical protein
MKSTASVAVLSVLYAFLGPGVSSRQQAPPAVAVQKARPPQKESDVADLMQQKRELSHDVFDAIVMKDFKRIDKVARALTEISQAAVWRVIQTPRYFQYTADFQDATEKMAQKARDKNADGTTLAFTQMTLACIRCHDYMSEKKRVRLESLAPERTARRDRGPDSPSHHQPDLGN